MFLDQFQKISTEISGVLSQIKQHEVDAFIAEIIQGKQIVTAGAGRVGLATKGFAMRLGHLGLSAHNFTDMTVPSIGKNDLLIVASGSGETQTIFDITERAKTNNAHIALITGNPQSRIGKLADTIVVLPAPSKIEVAGAPTSIQPMSTLNEQCLVVFFDTLVLDLMMILHQTHDTMWSRHSNLE